MTRKDDTFISLGRRTEIASENKADLFVSIHANANNKRVVNGFEVYTLRNLSSRDRLEDQRVENLKTTLKKSEAKTDDPYVEKIVEGLLYYKKQAESERLARLLARDTTLYVNAKNNGQKESRFFVLRNTLVPAILIETGYLSNPREEKLLSSSSYRQKIARGIVTSLMDYMNGKD